MHQPAWDRHLRSTTFFPLETMAQAGQVRVPAGAYGTQAPSRTKPGGSLMTSWTSRRWRCLLAASFVKAFDDLKLQGHRLPQDQDGPGSFALKPLIRLETGRVAVSLAIPVLIKCYLLVADCKVPPLHTKRTQKLRYDQER